MSSKLNKKEKIVFTNGCFDIVHVGHIHLLNEAKKFGDKLIVGLNSDLSVQRLKGSERPINNEHDRKFFLENLSSVDFVEVFFEDTPLELIKKIKPDVLVKGGDWPVDKIVGSDFVHSYGGDVLNINFKEGYSTTSLIEKIKTD